MQIHYSTIEKRHSSPVIRRRLGQSPVVSQLLQVGRRQLFSSSAHTPHRPRTLTQLAPRRQMHQQDADVGWIYPADPSRLT